MAKQRKSIFILATGGTIAMQKTSRGYAPAKGHLQKAMAQLPELNNPDMPLYTIYEYEQPIDSANMMPQDWYQIGKHIQQQYDHYDGFLILHGTDTMAYSASALSFMLENLNKPVILTGSQLPLFEARSDARENLINALLLASLYPIPEVCIYFNNKLFRGNRSKKIDAASFTAFDSPNYPALGKIGTDIRIRHELIREAALAPLRLQEIKTVNINTLRLFPGVSPGLFRQFIQMPLQALVLETYGVGTAPQEPRFLAAIKEAVDQGILIINCSQCAHARVKMSDYAAGNALLEAGVISGADMTVEAAIAKLFYLFSKDLSLADIKLQMTRNLRGELKERMD